MDASVARDYFDQPVDFADDRWLNFPPGSVARRTIDRLGEFVGPIEPSEVDWLRAVFRLTRSNGSPIFGDRGRSPSRLLELERWVRRVGDPHLAWVIGGWRPASPIGDETESAAPPLPSHAWPTLPLAVLRPGWTALGDCVAVDHRSLGATTTVEVAGRGVDVAWPLLVVADADGRDRPGPADLLGDRGLRGRLRVVVRGRPGDGHPDRGPDPRGAPRRPDADRDRGRPGRRRGPLGVARRRRGAARPRLARPDPLGGPRATGRPPDPARLARGELPDRPRGLVVEGREVVLRQRTDGPNRCLAVLVSWRKRPPTGWRTLTVAEKSADVPAGDRVRRSGRLGAEADRAC